METLNLSVLLSKKPYLCGCGKVHSAHLKEAVIESGAVNKLPGTVKKYGGTKAFVVTGDKKILPYAEKAAAVLEKENISAKLFMLCDDRPEPDERTMGSLILHFDYTCDIIIGVGTGVVNDLCKILAKLTNLPYIIVATAPSMDGFCSSTSSVARDGLKVSVDSKCPDAVIADLDILCAAPTELLGAGVGDMLAKYVSVCEWRIGRLVTGEYYCEDCADMMRTAVKAIVKNIDGICAREPEAVKKVMEGLLLSGIAADYAGVSRPASGVEHYFSHLWDMRFLEFGTPQSLHGLQCGIGTLLALDGYEKLKSIRPCRETALRNFGSFDKNAWYEKIGEFLGSASEVIIKGCKAAERYDKDLHEKRLSKISENYDDILKIAREELPGKSEIETILKKLGAPVKPSDFGVSDKDNALVFKMTKDIRDKYILSTLLWDMGVLDETAEEVYDR